MNEFIEAWKDAVLTNYLNFKDRLGRGGYWRYVAVNFVIFVILGILTRISTIFLIPYYLAAVALFIPGLAAAIRRLHDTGKSGWMILIGVIPILGWIVLIVFLAQSGQTELNTYGPPPAPAGVA